LGAIVYPISDFYLTNPIARASETMRRCSAEILHGQAYAEAAE
jgi:NADH-quinone oxidoreductase subunit G